MNTNALKNLNDPKLIQLLKEINTLKEVLKETQDQEKISFMKKQLADLQLNYNILLERRSINNCL